LIVVGAGPGDPELITLKAYRVLQEAPVILYDNLANAALLDWAHPASEKIYVGKLPYGAYTPQESIHALIKEKAFSAGRVIRLKGGDPFIFGRGFEENRINTRTVCLGEGLTAAQEDPISARWTGYFWPPKSGTYEFSLTQVGSAVLTIDGVRIIDDETPTRPPAGAELFPIPMRVVQLELRAGRGYPIQLDYVSGTLAFHLFRFGIRPPAGTIDEAVRIARNADVAVVFVGVSTTSETEGADRRDMELYGPQNELVEAVAAVNPRTVVVLNNGAPLRLPWIERVSAVVEAWLPGQEGARAVAEVLLGMTNPCGKLPLTFPRRLEDNPSYLYYSNGRDAHYGEGVFVGYRYYEKKKIEPLFPFGHGLSYTTFEYSNLRAPDDVLAGQPIHVSLEVTNTGTMPGRETVQLYVGDEVTQDVVRPVKELKGFHKVELAPGESQIVRFTLNTHDLAYYDVHRHAWHTTPGRYRLHVGSSAADIRATRLFNWIAPVDDRAPIEHSTFEDDL